MVPYLFNKIYKVVQIWPGLICTNVHTNQSRSYLNHLVRLSCHQKIHHCVQKCLLGLLCLPLSPFFPVTVSSTLKSTAILTEILHPIVISLCLTSYFAYLNLFHLITQEYLLRIKNKAALHYTGLFISPSGISELDCATTKTDTAEKSISIGREALQVFLY